LTPERAGDRQRPYPERKDVLKVRRWENAERGWSKNFLQRIAHHHPAEVVRIITGRGTNSEGEPVLGPALEGQLGELSEFVSEWQRTIDGGSYLVRLK
jgi:hypothetical protein